MEAISTYDVIVVGAGHAGSEAAGTAAQLGVKTLLITMNLEAIANVLQSGYGWSGKRSVDKGN